MIGLMQRVSGASVGVDGAIVAGIGRGLLVLVGVEAGDGEGQADRLLERLLGYRSDEAGRMLLADSRGCCSFPSFSSAAPPDVGAALFGYLLARAAAAHSIVAAGRFGADMKVALVNDGPVTFWLRVAPG